MQAYKAIFFNFPILPVYCFKKRPKIKPYIFAGDHLKTWDHYDSGKEEKQESEPKGPKEMELREEKEEKEKQKEEEIHSVMTAVSTIMDRWLHNQGWQNLKNHIRIFQNQCWF